MDFAIIWAPVSYREIGLLCGISESTVQHWFSHPTTTSHREPADRHQRLLAITGLTQAHYIAVEELKPPKEEDKQLW